MLCSNRLCKFLNTYFTAFYSRLDTLSGQDKHFINCKCTAVHSKFTKANRNSCLYFYIVLLHNGALFALLTVSATSNKAGHIRGTYNIIHNLPVVFPV